MTCLPHKFLGISQHRLISLSRVEAVIVGFKQPSEAIFQFVSTKIRQLLDILPDKGLYRLVRIPIYK
jgi:hypothetical protein